MAPIGNRRASSMSHRGMWPLGQRCCHNDWMKWSVAGIGVTLLVAACTSGGSETASTTALAPTIPTSPPVSASPPTTASQSTTVPESRLVVQYDQEGFYAEGSFVHLELYRYFRDLDVFPAQITVIDREAPTGGTVLLDATPAPGIYELRSYQRPCNGSCDVLEPPSDGCAVRLTLESGATATAVVTVRPGSSCAIDIEGAAVDAPERNMNLTLQPIGGPGCEPASPYDENPLAEVLATSNGETVVWGLLWQRPSLSVNRQIKMVFRLTGTGGFDVVARHEDGTEIVPNWGPNDHGTDSSSYGRPGNEWGMAFTFPLEGCWKIHFTRGADSADVWVHVGGRDA